MEDGTVYTHARWLVRPGKRDAFVRWWSEELVGYIRSLPAQPGEGTLIQSVDDPDVFYSFGPWQRLEDIQAMRADPRSEEVFGHARELCLEMTPGPYRVVATG